MSIARKIRRKDLLHVGKNADPYGNRFERRGYGHGIAGRAIKRHYKPRPMPNADYCPPPQR